MPIELPPQKNAPPSAPFQITGRMVLFALIAFFLIVAGVNAVMMTLAIRTMPGVDVKSAYEGSQNYNKDIQRAREQDARAWQANVTFVDGAARTITITMKDKAGQPVKGLDVGVRFAHPSDRKADIVAALSEIAPGQYTGDAAPRGVWDLQIEARNGKDIMFQSQSRLHP